MKLARELSEFANPLKELERESKLPKLTEDLHDKFA